MASLNEKKKKEKKSWLRPNYYHFWKIIWITLLLEFNCSRTQETRPCKCKWFHVWGKSKALMLWMKMLQNITQLSYYYLPQSKGSWRARNWKLFFVVGLLFLSDKIRRNEKRLRLQSFLNKHFSCHFFHFYSSRKLGKRRNFTKGVGDGWKEEEGREWAISYTLIITFLFKNKGPPEINSRREKSVKLNSTLQVDCLVRGFPQPEVNWTRDGKLLNTTNKLTIKQVTYGDAGQYTCSAKNSEGKREAAFWVTVTGKC